MALVHATQTWSLALVWQGCTTTVQSVCSLGVGRLSRPPLLSRLYPSPSLCPPRLQLQLAKLHPARNAQCYFIQHKIQNCHRADDSSTHCYTPHKDLYILGTIKIHISMEKIQQYQQQCLFKLYEIPQPRHVKVTLPSGTLFIWRTSCNADATLSLAMARSYHDSAIGISTGELNNQLLLTSQSKI